MKSKWVAVSVAVLLVGWRACAETNITIRSFANGQVTWENVDTGLFYTVEWRASLAGSAAWTNGYQALRDIQSANPTVTSSVPVFYRVCGTSNRMVHPAPLPRTGQTPTVPQNPASSGSDGDLQKGVPWPVPRFTDPGDGTVRDNLTGLVWLKNANPCGTQTWDNALAYCSSLSNGVAGLTDGSVAGDWRLPNITELQSLLARQYANPTLADTAGTGHWNAGDPFTGVVSLNYWTSSTYAESATAAWMLNVWAGITYLGGKTAWQPIWPVRGGE